MISPIEFYIYFSVVCIMIYLMFPRQSKNLIYTIVPKWNREFVVVYFRKMATKKPLKYYVRPNEKTGFGTIEKGSYDLHKDHALKNIPLFKNRLHFLVDEGNSIPVHADIVEVDDISKLFVYKRKIFFDKGISVHEHPHEYVCPECHKTIIPDKSIIRTWAFRVKSALTTQAYDFIYGEKRQWAFIIALVAAVIAIVVALYAVSEIQYIKPLVTVIYERTIAGNETMVIRQR